MLRELHISNLAVIADARIEFAAGLNCFTGTTGAGKSLVIGAIELLLGLRSPAEMLRPGVDEGRVSGLFDLRDSTIRSAVERQCDLSLESDELLLVRRLYASGRSSVSLNGNPITLGMLKQIAELLVDVHGQHDHQFLLKPANQLDVLDQFAHLADLRQRYHEVFAELQSARRQLDRLTADRNLRQQQLELYRFQADEIDRAELTPGEYEELSARASVLRNLEKLTREATATHSALYEIEGSVLERLKMMSAVIGELSMLDQNLKPIAKNLRDSTIGLEEVAFDLSRYLDKLDLDPAEIAEVEDRLNTLNRLLSKYGPAVEDALTRRADLNRQINDLTRAGDDLLSIQVKVDPLAKQLIASGEELSTNRKAAARRLAPQVESALAELGMEKATFAVKFSRAAEPSASGIDDVEFIARTNPGQLELPLRKIASGGELSRIMLALKGILAAGDRTSVLVFDEIDSNVGGRLGSIIGDKLRKLAAHHQVLCITHLPQIASYADHHLTVRKHVAAGKTQTTVRPIEGDDRIAELAEMIGGQRVTATTLAQASEMLDSAANPPRVQVSLSPSGRKKPKTVRTG